MWYGWRSGRDSDQLLVICVIAVTFKRALKASKVWELCQRIRWSQLQRAHELGRYGGDTACSCVPRRTTPQTC
ncbi:hypothetical protein BD414DRAFT_491600 [Trametes punicea]|nr:hypothetical protein BD414DRAFT_491600 [Trametes punicea]